MKSYEVIYKYNRLVPFPISPERIQAAGFNVIDYLRVLVYELSICENHSDPRIRRIVRKLQKTMKEVKL